MDCLRQQEVRECFVGFSERLCTPWLTPKLGTAALVNHNVAIAVPCPFVIAMMLSWICSPTGDVPGVAVSIKWIEVSPFDKLKTESNIVGVLLLYLEL